MATNSKSTTLRIIVWSYGLLYFGLLILPMLTSASYIEEMSIFEIYSVPMVFALFASGALFTLKDERIAGLILLSWHFITWVFSLLFWPQAGGILFLIFPMLFPAILLIRNWYIQNMDQYQKCKLLRLRLTLRIFLFNFLVIYALIVFANVVPKLIGWSLASNVDELAVWNYSSAPGILLLAAFMLFLAGVVYTWRSEFVGGAIFIIWYVAVILLALKFPEFANSGPWSVIGLVIPVLGIMYMTLSSKMSKLNRIN